MTSEWIAQIVPYANFIVGMMKTILPMVAPSVNVLFGSGAFDQWRYKEHFEFAPNIAQQCPARRNQSPRSGTFEGWRAYRIGTVWSVSLA
jgi:hypothetical protein